MLQEAMEVFQIMLQEKGERIITDAYIPKDGTYRLIVMKDDGWVIKDPVDIIFNKKTNTVDISNDMDYLLIQELDYKSKLLEMNKPIDPKKVIHSNNYLSLAVKKESVTSGKLSEEIIQQYYEILRNPNKKYEKKPQARALYHVAEERLGQPDIEAIDKIEKFILANKQDIWKDINLEKKNYVKLFFVYQEEEKTKEIYKIESERYLIPNIYNNNNFNMEFEKGYGEFEGERNGRYFTDFTEDSLKEFILQIPQLQIKEIWTTGDVREGRGDERWLNILICKGKIS